MTTLKASAARSRLYRLIDETASSHEPIMIAGKRSSAVLISEDDWRAIQETIYLLSIPRMRQSIRKGLATSIGKCAKKLPGEVGVGLYQTSAEGLKKKRSGRLTG
jgi:antitoxin YefM